MKSKFNIRYFGRFLTIALGVAALVACEKVTEDGEDVWNPLTGDTPVRIRTSVTAPETKVTGTAFDNGDQIGIFGFYHNGSGSTDGSWAAETSAGTNIPDYMFNQRMTYNGSTSVWDYSPIKYWPNETSTDGNGATSAHIDKLSFWGYYPYGGSGISFRAHGTSTAYTNATAGLPDVYFTQSTTPASQVDFMTSDTKLNLYKGMDKGVSDHYGNLTDGEVDLTFHHRLTQLSLKAKKQDANDYTVTISSIRFVDVTNAGTFTPDPAGWTPAGTTASYTALNTNVTLTNSAVSVGSTLYMLPQTLTAGKQLEVVYTITGPGDLAQYAAPYTATVDLKDILDSSDNPIDEWVANQQITYSLSISPSRLYLIASCLPWDEGGSSTFDPSIQTNLLIDTRTYRRYDEDGNFSSWTDSYVAVADGTDGAGELLSPRLLLTTTSTQNLELVMIPANDNFRFVQYTSGVGLGSPAATLTIPSGTDVVTYYYVVPTNSTIPASADDCKAHVYLRAVGGYPYVPYNASVFPGNDVNTTCQYYIVSPATYTGGDTANIRTEND